MTFRAYLGIMAATTLLAWGGWVGVIWQVNPEEAGWLGFLLFYLTFGAALIGTIATLSLAYRVLILKREVLMREVRITIRHALLLGIGGVAALWLAAQNLLTWWVGFGLIVVIGLVEYLFLLAEGGHRG